MMTREEHLKWSKDRAIAEMDYYKDPSKAYISIASDQLMMRRNTRQQVIDFLNGFN